MKPDAISYNSLIYALVQEPWVFEVGRQARLLYLCALSREPASDAALQNTSNEEHVFFFMRVT